MTTSSPSARARTVRRGAVAACVAALALALATPVEADADAGADTGDRDRVVVEFAPATAPGVADDVVADALGDATPAPDAGALLAPLAAGPRQAPPAVVEVTARQRAALAADPAVAAVYDDVPVRLDAAPTPVGATAVVPNDPSWSGQSGVRRIEGDDLWEQTTGTSDVVIAVVDTGVDPGNDDLQGRLLGGRDFVNDDLDPTDDHGHGTSAATIAAGAGNDAVGIAGLCWGCRVLPVKVLDENGEGYLSDAAAGIAWAVAQGADVINASLGSPDTIPVLDDALQDAADAGVLVVASAGNAGSSARQWPAGDAHAMAVAALGSGDTRASYSNYGSWVDVAAPGCNPAVTLANVVETFCGTSSAAPLVSGAAALLTSLRGATPATEVRTALRATAVDLGAGLGSGRIDAVAAADAMAVFTDIAGNTHADNIETVAAEDVAAGCTTIRYCPADPITRGQMATLLDRALDLPAGTASYTDVGAGHAHAAGIAAITSAGIAQGCTATRFCPGATLTRAQMATLLDRALGLPDGPRRFTDVAPGSTHATGIWAIAAAGVTTGCATNRYCPTEPVTRAQMATFLVRGLEL